jgi:hypothetical protein
MAALKSNEMCLSDQEAGQAVPNPFTSNACMIAVQSGPALVEIWEEGWIRRDSRPEYFFAK